MQEQQLVQAFQQFTQKCVFSLDPCRNPTPEELNNLGVQIFGFQLHFKQYEEQDDIASPAQASPGQQWVCAAANSVQRGGSGASEKEGSTDLEFHCVKPTSRVYHTAHSAMKSYTRSFNPANLGLHRLCA